MTNRLKILGLDNKDLPVMVAPMFLVSGPELVTACCQSGVVGSFPALNNRTTEGFEQWLLDIKSTLAQQDKANQTYAVNLIAHKSNARLEADLAICVKHQVPLIITSLGAVTEVVDEIHAYGGMVFHDVTSIHHAKKAIAAGVDGLILVCAGAGGHGGTANPIAFVEEVRQFFDGYIGLAGGISNGRGVATAIAAGADFAYVGTRFVITSESQAPAEYKAMMQDASLDDIIYTDAISGIHGNFLRQSIEAAGVDPKALKSKHKVDLGAELKPGSKAWKNIWAAGQGVGVVSQIDGAAEVVEQMRKEYKTTLEGLSALR